jgi:hypothetical protein
MALKKPSANYGSVLVKRSALPKRPSWDIFDTYFEMPRSRSANIEMKAVCDKFIAEFKKVSLKYQREGLADSAARDMIIRYVLEDLEPWRKKWRLQKEKELGMFPRRK